MKTTIDMVREAGFAINVSTDPNSPPSWWGAGHDDRFKALEALVRADEREACAKEADKWSKRDDDAGAFIGKAIRARNINLELNDKRTI
jgi:hypothetical protein